MFYVCCWMCRGATRWYPDKQDFEEMSGPVLEPDPKSWRWKVQPWNRMYGFLLSLVIKNGIVYHNLSVSSISDKASVYAKLYIETLLSRFIEECKSLLPSGFIFSAGLCAWLRGNIGWRLDCRPSTAVVNLLAKMYGHKIHLALTFLIIASG